MIISPPSQSSQVIHNLNEKYELEAGEYGRMEMDMYSWDFITIISKKIFWHYEVCLCISDLQVYEAFTIPWYQHNPVLHICKSIAIFILCAPHLQNTVVVGGSFSREAKKLFLGII